MLISWLTLVGKATYWVNWVALCFRTIIPPGSISNFCFFVFPTILCLLANMYVTDKFQNTKTTKGEQVRLDKLFEVRNFLSSFHVKKINLIFIKTSTNKIKVFCRLLLSPFERHNSWKLFNIILTIIDFKHTNVFPFSSWQMFKTYTRHIHITRWIPRLLVLFFFSLFYFDIQKLKTEVDDIKEKRDRWIRDEIIYVNNNCLYSKLVKLISIYFNY